MLKKWYILVSKDQKHFVFWYQLELENEKLASFIDEDGPVSFTFVSWIRLTQPSREAWFGLNLFR